MAGVRTRKQNGSLGDSWGTADYSDDNMSIGSADSFSDSGSQSDYFEERGRDVLEDEDEDNMATPMPHPRTTRISHPPQDSPTKTPTARLPARPQTSKSGSRQYQQPTPQQSPEPAFIMPSLNASVDGFPNASPLRTSQMKSRKPRQASAQSRSTPRMARPVPSAGGTRQIHRRTSASTDHKAQEPVNPLHFVSLFWQNVARPILRYALDIFALTMTSMKPLFGLFFLIGFLVLALNFASLYLRNTFHSAIAPLCTLPLSSYILPFCASLSSEPTRDPNFEDLTHLQSSFEDILATSHASYALPANMKKSQTAMRDLRLSVQFSTLPSRVELESELISFIDAAREASDDLAKYNARTSYVVDQLISTNRWTLAVLSELSTLEAQKPAWSDSLAAINVFNIFSASKQNLQQRVFAQYVNHVTKTKDDIATLITFSEAVVAQLNNLDARLDTIAEIAMRDDSRIRRNHEEMLAEILSMVGGNRATKAANEANFELLRDVLRYRANAVQLVSATLLKLREISQGLENLRDGVAAPELVGYREEYPLQWHIDVVGRSLERLRNARGEAMAVEQDVINSLRDKGMGVVGERTEGMRVLPRGEVPTVYARGKEL